MLEICLGVLLLAEPRTVSLVYTGPRLAAVRTKLAEHRFESERIATVLGTGGKASAVVILDVTMRDNTVESIVVSSASALDFPPEARFIKRLAGDDRDFSAILRATARDITTAFKKP